MNKGLFRSDFHAKDNANLLVKFCIGMALVAVSAGFSRLVTPAKPPFRGLLVGTLEAFFYENWGAESVPYLWWGVAVILFLLAIILWFRGAKSASADD